jgi:hypothetical protein
MSVVAAAIPAAAAVVTAAPTPAVPVVHAPAVGRLLVVLICMVYTVQSMCSAAMISPSTHVHHALIWSVVLHIISASYRTLKQSITKVKCAVRRDARAAWYREERKLQEESLLGRHGCMQRRSYVGGIVGHGPPLVL